MTATYRLFGSELSPYSVKVRSYFRYKGVPHEWVLRTRDNMAEFEAHAKLPLLPLVVGPGGWSMQDSTPVVMHFDRHHPRPPIHPRDPVAAFVSVLLEEYGDEWANKPMFHYRWTYPADQQVTAERIARSTLPGATEDEIAETAAAIRERMVARRRFVGSSEETADQLEASFQRLLAMLQRHLEGRPYLFGGRPAFGDFGLAAQLYQMATDPTPGRLLREHAPAVLQWVHRMLEPRDEGPFEPWATLRPTLRPLLGREIAETFLTWSVANAKALDAGAAEAIVPVDRAPFRHDVSKYAAKSLAALRERYRAAASSALDEALADAGVLKFLRAA